MLEYDPEKEYQKYRVEYTCRGGFVDVDHVFAENENDAWYRPLGLEEYEEIERISVVVVSGI